MNAPGPYRIVGTRPLLACTILAGVFLAAAPFAASPGTLRLLTEMLVVLTMAHMWNLLAGYAGLLSIGHQGFVGIGAFGLFAISNHLSLSPILALPISIALCALIAAAVAPFLFRLRDAYFSVGIWVLAEIARLIVSDTAWLGGMLGLPLRMARNMNRDWFAIYTYWLASALALGLVVGIYLLLRSRLGLALMAVRDNERTAASVGIDVWRSRFLAFVLSAAGCGGAGAIFYMASFFVMPPQAFDVNWVVIMLFIVIVGGIGTLEGPFIGTLIYFVLRETFSQTGNWYLIIMGTVAVATMILAPRGIWGFVSARTGLEIFSVRRLVPGGRERTGKQR